MNDKTKKTNAEYCPDCGDALLPDSVKCSCGWTKEPKSKRRRFVQCSHDGQCQFQIGKMRCPLPGNHCASHASGPWLCHYHERNPHKDADGARMLNDIVQNEKKYTPDYSWWRDRMCDEIIEANQLKRRNDETHSAFIRRCYERMPEDVRQLFFADKHAT